MVINSSSFVFVTKHFSLWGDWDELVLVLLEAPRSFGRRRKRERETLI